jgi:hypothetical protein
MLDFKILDEHHTVYSYLGITLTITRGMIDWEYKGRYFHVELNIFGKVSKITLEAHDLKTICKKAESWALPLIEEYHETIKEQMNRLDKITSKIYGNFGSSEGL